MLRVEVACLALREITTGKYLRKSVPSLSKTSNRLRGLRPSLGFSTILEGFLGMSFTGPELSSYKAPYSKPRQVEKKAGTISIGF
jgi:hypothetical protein